MAKGHWRLRAKIAERYPNIGAFADAVGCSRNLMSMMLNGKVDFSKKWILKICELLCIETEDIGDYFFAE